MPSKQNGMKRSRSTSSISSSRTSKRRSMSRSSTEPSLRSSSSSVSTYNSLQTPRKTKRNNTGYNGTKKQRHKRDYDHIMPNLTSDIVLSPLGADKSLNGTLYKVKSNKSNAWQYIMKLPQDDDGNYHTDNLAYEFLVGMYLNVQRMYFPCFLKTHSLLEFKHLNSGHNSKKLLYQLLNKKDLLSDASYKAKFDKILSYVQSRDKIHIKQTCDNKYNFGVLIDYVDGDTLYNIKQKQTLLDVDLYAILFQIYAVLYALDGEYQHRDLHENNVMVYTFQDDVQFEYKIYAGEDDHDENKKHDKPEIVSFRSKYLAKIIDYGRGMIPEMKPMVEHYETLVQDVNTAKDKYSNDSNDSTDAYGEYMEALHVHNETLEQLKKCGFHHITFDTDDFRLFPGARNLPFIVHTLKDLLTDSTQTQTPTIKMTIDARPNLEPNERSYITVENLQDDKMAAFLYESNESGLNSIQKRLPF